MHPASDMAPRAVTAFTPSVTLGTPSDPVGSSALRMFRFERRWLLRVFETVLPTFENDGGKNGQGVPAALGVADVPMGRFVDDLLTHAPLLSVIGLRAALWMVMLAPLVLL